MDRETKKELCVKSVYDIFQKIIDVKEDVREAYKDYTIIDQEYRYCMSFDTDENGNKKTKMKNELIITNY